MRIIFFGSDIFAVPSLEALLKVGEEIACVITQPDKTSGRGLSLVPTPVKALALKDSLRVCQPADINTGESLDLLRSLKPDLFVVIAYGQMLCAQALDIPRLMAVNLHASLLPQYRGAAPVNWAIIKGEGKTGVSVIKITPKMDSGPLIAQDAFAIEKDDTAVSLSQRLADSGAGLMLRVIRDIAGGNYRLTPQEEECVTFAPKLKKQDGLINWDRPAAEIADLVRGCFDWPGAYTYYKGKTLKVFKAKPVLSAGSPQAGGSGEVLAAAKDGITVACGSGCLILEEVQLQGGRPMRAEEFINGHRVSPGELLVKK